MTSQPSTNDALALFRVSSARHLTRLYHISKTRSIDLLHIDGFHTYDVVSHDFKFWFPKLSPNAVILFHDTNVRENNFGVFRLWSEIASGRLHFNFQHGHGLGVLGLGHNYSNALRVFFDANVDSRLGSSVREIFASLGLSARLLCERSALDQVLSERDREVGGLRAALIERDHAVVDRDGQIASLNRVVVERDGQIANLRDEVAHVMIVKDREICTVHQELDQILHSRSWRVTAALRKVAMTTKRVVRLPRVTFLGKIADFLGFGLTSFSFEIVPFLTQIITLPVTRMCRIPAWIRRGTICFMGGGNTETPRPRSAHLSIYSTTLMLRGLASTL